MELKGLWNDTWGGHWGGSGWEPAFPPGPAGAAASALCRQATATALASFLWAAGPVAGAGPAPLCPLTSRLHCQVAWFG